MSDIHPEALVPKPTKAELLLEQYKLLEERRKYFGNQFMQTTGGVGVAVSILVGLLGGKSVSEFLLRFSLFIGGVAFFWPAFLGYRLGRRQNDCERSMVEIENLLRGDGYTVVSMQPGAKAFGARYAIVSFLVAIGLCLIVVALFFGQALSAAARSTP